jgi:glycosyltransferase involved in cell wall biosynthesis
LPFTFGRHRVRQSLVLARSLLSREPYRLRKFRSSEFEQRLAARLAQTHYDLIHFDQFGVMPYARLASADVPRIAAHQNVESDIYRLAAARRGNPVRRLVAAIEARKLRRAEAAVLGTFDHVFVLTPEDRKLLKKMGVDRTSVVPMPVEVRGRIAGSPADLPAEPPAGRRIISLGSMSWYGVADGLLWFHDQVLPRVREQVPDVEWELAGPNAPASIRRLAGEPGISLPGYVDDIDAHLAAARVGIIPLNVAGGIRMKLLHFMELGLPAVSTTIGARGLAFEDGEGCFRRDDPGGFAETVTSLLTDDVAWRKAVVAGRDFVNEHHSLARFDAAIDEGLALAYRRHQLGPVGGLQ